MHSHQVSGIENNKYSVLSNILDLYENRKENLIQILHAVQNAYGCIPLDLQQTIAVRLGIPLSKVSGVISFYSFFQQNQEDSTLYRSAWVQPVMFGAARAPMNTLDVEPGIRQQMANSHWGGKVHQFTDLHLPS